MFGRDYWQVIATDDSLQQTVAVIGLAAQGVAGNRYFFDERLNQFDLAGIGRPGARADDKLAFAKSSGRDGRLDMGFDLADRGSPVKFHRIGIFETETRVVLTKSEKGVRRFHGGF